jgi:hypothetical protein
MEVNEEILDDFFDLTGFNVKSYFTQYASFFQRNYPVFVSFYSGDSERLPQQSEDNLKRLKRTASDVSSTFSEFGEYLNDARWWILLEELENMKVEIDTVDNLPKWLRSSTSRSQYTASTQAIVNLKQGQTLEQLNRGIGIDDWNNQWTQTAYNNNLDEEDYTPDSQAMLKVFLTSSGSIKVLSIVDEIIDRNILGKDIQRKFEFRDNDLVTLPPDDTFIQTVNILVNLRKRDNPSFPNQGINPKIVVGSNLSALAYPIVFRDLTANFATDDSIKSFSLLDIKREQDAVYFKFQVESRLGDLKQITSTFSN